MLRESIFHLLKLHILPLVIAENLAPCDLTPTLFLFALAGRFGRGERAFHLAPEAEHSTHYLRYDHKHSYQYGETDEKEYAQYVEHRKEALKSQVS